MPTRKTSMNTPTHTEGSGQLVLDRETRNTSPPPLWKVVMLNDDFTPMEFVVAVLQAHFQKTLETAMQLMLQIHHQGRAVCGVYSKDVAETKVECVLHAARHHGHPLQCLVEQA